MGCIHRVKHKNKKERTKRDCRNRYSASPHCILAPQSTEHSVPSKDTILGTEEQLSKSLPYFPRVTTKSSIIINEDCDLDVRGAANVHFRMNAQDLVNTHHPEILVILEPKISGTHVEHVINQVGLPHHFQVDPMGCQVVSGFYGKITDAI